MGVPSHWGVTVSAIPLLLAGVLAVGCGGGTVTSSTSIAPTPTSTTTTTSTPTPAATPTVASLAISPATDLLRIAQGETFTVSATMSNGTVQTVTPSWSVDNTSVLTSDFPGHVWGVGNGTATFTATYLGVVARRTIRVVPDFGRNWVGLRTVTACTETGQQRQCSAYPVGGSALDDLLLRQTRDALSGTMSMGTTTAVTGSVQADGGLTLQGQSTSRVNGANVTTTLSQYSGRTTSSTRMAATYSFVITNDSNTSRAQVSFSSTYIGSN